MHERSYPALDRWSAWLCCAAGKKFASGASVVKNAEGKEHIDCQVGPLGGVGGWWPGGSLHDPRMQACQAGERPVGLGMFPCTPWPTAPAPATSPCPTPQGDFLDQAAELIVKQWKEVKKSDVYYIDSKKKVPYWPDAEEEAA